MWMCTFEDEPMHALLHGTHMAMHNWQLRKGISNHGASNFQGYSCTAVPVRCACGPEVALLYIFTDLRLQYAWVLGDGPRCHNSYVSRFSDPASLSNVERCRPSHERAARTHDTVLYPYAAAEPPRSSSAVPSAAAIAYAIAHTRTRATQARPQAAASSPNERDAEQHLLRSSHAARAGS